MRTGWNPVIIDNTNTQAWHMLPYVRLVCHFYHIDNNDLPAVDILHSDSPFSADTVDSVTGMASAVPKGYHLGPGLAWNEVQKNAAITENPK